jgi:hypothetical protein
MCPKACLELCAGQLLLSQAFALLGHLFGVKSSLGWLAWLEERGAVLLLTHTSNRLCILGLV